MIKFVLILVITGYGVEGQLQAWHRKDCPLVMDLNKILSKLVANNFNLSEYYTTLGNDSVLRILVRKLVFCKFTNRGMAVLKIFSNTSTRVYFFVLLENCTCDDERNLHFELNTTYKPDFYDSLSKAKSAATEYENAQPWNNSNERSTPLGRKTDLPKRAKQVGALAVGTAVVAGVVMTWPISVPIIIACILDSNPSSTKNKKGRTYCPIAKHWQNNQGWAADSTYDLLQGEGKKFKISARVYKPSTMPSNLAS